VQTGVSTFCARQLTAEQAAHAPVVSLQTGVLALAVAQLLLSLESLPVAQPWHAPVDSLQIGVFALDALQVASSVDWVPVAHETQLPFVAPFAVTQIGVSAFSAAQSASSAAWLPPVVQAAQAPVDELQIGTSALAAMQPALVHGVHVSGLPEHVEVVPLSVMHCARLQFAHTPVLAQMVPGPDV
jgi:hypothetical protein